MSIVKRLNLNDFFVLESLNKVNQGRGFTVLFSNPPYQIQTIEKTGTAVYPDYMNIAQQLSNFVSMIYPARWVNSGKSLGMKEFRDKEAVSQHYLFFKVVSDASEIFSEVSIAGGVNYFLWADKLNNCNDLGIHYVFNNDSTKINKLSINSMIILNPKHHKIAEKINTNESIKVFGRDWYGWHLSSHTQIQKYLSTNNDNSLDIYYFSSQTRQIIKDSIFKDSTHRETNDYKIFVGKTTETTNNYLRKPGRMFIGKPNEICSSTFLKIGSFTTEQYAINCLLYIKTDFVTFLIGITQLTQNSSSKNYALIPDVDFVTGEIKDKPGAFLNFEKPETLDTQLSEIYKLNKTEQKLIKQSIKPWKNKLDIE